MPVAVNVIQVPKPSRGKTPVDHAGKRFGRLLVLSYYGRQVSRTKPTCGNAVWLCRCDCGQETRVIARSLVDGTTRSCGCYWKESARSRGGFNRLEVGKSAFNQLLGAYRKSARQRGYTFFLTTDEFHALTQQSCFYCGSEPTTKYRAAKGTNGSYIGNGVDRIDNSLGYEIGNVVACCKQCNIAKGVLGQDEFIEWARRVVARFEHGESGPVW